MHQSLFLRISPDQSFCFACVFFSSFFVFFFCFLKLLMRRRGPRAIVRMFSNSADFNSRWIDFVSKRTPADQGRFVQWLVQFNADLISSSSNPQALMEVIKQTPLKDLQLKKFPVGLLLAVNQSRDYPQVLDPLFMILRGIKFVVPRSFTFDDEEVSRSK